MPVTKSANKHLRQTKKITVRNQRRKRHLHDYIKDVRAAISHKEKDALEKYAQGELQKVLDKAAKAGLIKKNNAARRKSRLMRQVQTVVK